MNLRSALGAAYGLALTGFGILAAGAGHGTYVPIGLFSSPLGVAAVLASAGPRWASLTEPAMMVVFFGTPLLWAVGFWLCGAESSRARRGFLIGILAHYAVAVALLAREPFGDWSHLTRTGTVSAIGVLVYLVGQTLLWLRYIGASRHVPKQAA